MSVAVALFVCDLKLAERSHTLTTKETNEIIYFTVLYFGLQSTLFKSCSIRLVVCRLCLERVVCEFPIIV